MEEYQNRCPRRSALKTGAGLVMMGSVPSIRAKETTLPELSEGASATYRLVQNNGGTSQSVRVLSKVERVSRTGELVTVSTDFVKNNEVIDSMRHEYYFENFHIRPRKASLVHDGSVEKFSPMMNRDATARSRDGILRGITIANEGGQTNLQATQINDIDGTTDNSSIWLVPSLSITFAKME